MKFQQLLEYDANKVIILKSGKKERKNIFVLIRKENNGLYLLNKDKRAIVINHKGIEKLGWMRQWQIFIIEEKSLQEEKKLHYWNYKNEKLELKEDEFDFVDYIDDYDYYYEDYFTDIEPIYEKRQWKVLFKGENIIVTIENMIDQENSQISVKKEINYTKESENNTQKYKFKEKELDEFKKYLEEKEKENMHYYFINYHENFKLRETINL